MKNTITLEQILQSQDMGDKYILGTVEKVLNDTFDANKDKITGIIIDAFDANHKDSDYEGMITDLNYAISQLVRARNTIKMKLLVSH